MKKTLPISDTVYSINKHLFLIEDISSSLPEFSEQHHTEIYFTKPSTNIPFETDHGNSIHYPINWHQYVAKENDWNNHILYTIHPEDIDENTPGFNYWLSDYISDFERGVLPQTLVAKMEEIYRVQYEIFTSKSFKKPSDNIFTNIINWIFQSSAQPTYMDSIDYYRLSFENLLYIRDRNMLYWIARKEKNGINISNALKAIRTRGLKSRYEKIKSSI